MKPTKYSEFLTRTSVFLATSDNQCKSSSVTISDFPSRPVLKQHPAPPITLDESMHNAQQATDLLKRNQNPYREAATVGQAVILAFH